MNLGKIQPPTTSKSGKTKKIKCQVIFRGRSRTVATSKMEHFVIIVNGWKPLTIITKRSILDVAVVLDPSIFDVIICLFSFLAESLFLALRILIGCATGTEIGMVLFKKYITWEGC